MKRDDLIFDIIEKEHQRQLKGIDLHEWCNDLDAVSTVSSVKL